MEITAAEKERILRSADAWMADRDATIRFELDRVLTAGLIGHLQLAFRHPANNGATREKLEEFVRLFIQKLDPQRGDVYKFLMMGFDEIPRRIIWRINLWKNRKSLNAKTAGIKLPPPKAAVRTAARRFAMSAAAPIRRLVRADATGRAQTFAPSAMRKRRIYFKFG